MKLRAMIENLEKLEKQFGDTDVVIYAYGGDFGGFLYPGDAIFGDAIVLPTKDTKPLFFPDYDVDRCGVPEESEQLTVLKFKYSIEVDNIRNDHEEFDLDLVDGNETPKKWYTTGKVYNFEKESIINVLDWNNED